jgi:AcrR family transcriptional regulator
MATPPSSRGRGRPRTADRTRQAIKDAAIELWRDRGYAGISIQDIADRLGLTKPAFYYHLRTKEDLLNEIAMDGLDLMQVILSEIAESSARPSQKMAAIVDAYVELMTERAGLFAVYFEEKNLLNPDSLKTVTERERKLLGIVRGVYVDGVQAGEFKDVDPTVAVLGILGQCFWVYKWYRADGSRTPAQISELIQSTAATGYLKQE